MTCHFLVIRKNFNGQVSKNGSNDAYILLLWDSCVEIFITLINQFKQFGSKNWFFPYLNGTITAAVTMGGVEKVQK